MHRRKVLKQLLFATGAVLIVPACMQDKSKASILLKNISISGNQEKVMNELVDSLIPSSDTPGAKDVSAQLFVLMMVDDCYNKEDQQKFIKGLNDFEKLAKKQMGKNFETGTIAEREAVLKEVEAGNTGNDALNYFYQITKRLTIHAYTSSKFYLTKVQVYKMVPGHFLGCVPVKSAS